MLHNKTATRGAMRLLAGFIAGSQLLMYAHVAAEGQAVTGEAPKQHTPRHVAGSSIDDRVRILSQALNLYAGQQAELNGAQSSPREVMQPFVVTSVT